MEYELLFNASFFAAFAMGLFSSLHCIGMCGSIIGTLTLSLKPEIRNNKSTLFPYVLNYNIGRIFSYTLAGFLVGLAESLLTLPFGAGHGHRVLQLFSALIMVGAGLYIAGWFPRFAYIEKAGSRLWKLIEPFGRQLIPVATRSQAFLFGMVWGWLPCGLVYAALAPLPSVMGVGIMTDVLTKLSRMQRFKQFIGILLVLIALISVFPWLNPMRLQHF